MRSMFESAVIGELILGNFDTSKVTDMSDMFAGAQIETLYLKGMLGKFGTASIGKINYK